ncbi:isoleucine--tRNA ligase [Candidatus Micrarchaeota archaeon]|nr:isoleucine--tRNA ligase [Candidatus Micrarchaeota archaeon]
MASVARIAKYDLKQIEASVRDFWEAEKIPQGLAAARKGAKPFYLLDGPPYVNNELHVGNLKTTICKDVWSRFKYMQGYDVFFQPGFDCHGLPVEVIVEKELGVTAKSDIEKMGVEKFDAICLDKVLNNEKKFMELYKQVGAWRGWFEGYFTYKDYFIESAWWTAKQLHEKGLLVEGEKSIHWCPHCETALSGYEVSDSYKDLQAPSIYLKFKVKGADNEYLVAWTTTPWTLPANVALAVHPGEYYVRAKVGSDVFIIAEKRLAQALGEEIGVGYEVISRVKGSELEGMQYEPLLDVPIQRGLAGKAHKIILSLPIMTNKKYKKHVMSAETDRAGGASGEKQAVQAEEFEEFVTMDAGAGIVHTAPGHGQTDNFIGKHYGLPQVCPVDEHGRLTKDAGEFAGLSTAEADPVIVEKLEAEGKLLHADKFTHRAAVCWRCKTPLIFRLSPQWYMKVDSVKEEILSANENINWMPPFGRVKFQNWIADREDWCLSQQRYWGIPMPIWVCGKCGAKKVIGSKKELAENAVKKFDSSALTDLHRHSVDGIEIKCAACGGTAKRVKDIFTVWFDSGVTPWASLGYPFKNKELFEKMFPVALICESQDQIRGWFDSLMLCSMGAFGKPSYQAVALMGWVLDEKGEKMSKSLGNVILAKDGAKELGSDVIRLYYCSEIAPWEVQNFSMKNAKELQRDLTIFYNILSFYQMYVPSGFTQVDFAKAKLAIEDKWLLSRANTVSCEVTGHLEKFEFQLVGRKLLDFIVNDFSRWYIKLVRDRVSPTAGEEDKRVCLSVMREALETSAKLLAPVSPFLSEYVFQQIRSPSDEKSVHYCGYPEFGKDASDEKLEQHMALAAQVTELAASARQEAGIKLRWPVREVVVVGSDAHRESVRQLNEILRASTNSLSVRFSEQVPQGDFVSREAKDVKVFVLKTLDEELKNTALFRELTRAVQESRKKNGFNVNDSIALSLFADPATAEFLGKKIAEVKSAVGASSVAFASSETALAGQFVAQAELEEKRVSAKYARA